MEIVIGTACNQVQEITTAVSHRATENSWIFKRPEYFPTHDVTDYTLQREHNGVLALLS